MEQGTEEVVAIADLPSRVAKLVQGLGMRSLVATKRQAPAAEIPPASLLPQKEAGGSSQASARQASASPSQQAGPPHSLPVQPKQGKHVNGQQDGGITLQEDSQS